MTMLLVKACSERITTYQGGHVNLIKKTTACRPSSPALIASLADALNAIGAETKDYGVGVSLYC